MPSLPLSGFLVAKLGSRKSFFIVFYLTQNIIFFGASGSVAMVAVTLFCFRIFGNMFNIALNTKTVGVENLYSRYIIAASFFLVVMLGFCTNIFSTLIKIEMGKLA